MFNTFDFMALNGCCILGGPYYPTCKYMTPRNLLSEMLSAANELMDDHLSVNYPTF